MYTISRLVAKVCRVDSEGARSYRSSVPGLPLGTYELLERVCDGLKNQQRKTRADFAMLMAEEIEKLIENEPDDLFDECDMVENFLMRMYSEAKINAIDVATITGYMEALLFGLSHDEAFCKKVIAAVEPCGIERGRDYCLRCNYSPDDDYPSEIVRLIDSWCYVLVRSPEVVVGWDWIDHFAVAMARRIVQLIEHQLDEGANIASVAVDEKFVSCLAAEIIPNDGEMRVPPYLRMVFYNRATCSFTVV